MPSRRSLRLFWARYVCPARLERDPHFRAVLADATRRGLTVAGFAGLAALAALLAGAFGRYLMLSRVMGDAAVVDAALQLGEAFASKLRVLAAGVLFLGVARLRPSVSLGRALVVLYVGAVAWAFLADDLFYATTLSLTAAWFGLLMMMTAGTVPFQPWQTAAVGTALTFALAVGVGPNEVEPAGPPLRFVYLVLTTVIATAMTAAIYGGRYAQHRVARRLAGARARLGERSRQLETQRASLQRTVENEERMRAQLVQKEKMASLGQLTAGVAHELKNPLNFVTNFAQISVETVDELEAELRADPSRPVADALAASADLLADLRANAEKIHEHGRRADGIIKSMLAHSRATPGPRRPARLNPLMDEYVGLAYHGMRAAHSGFHVDLDKAFDPTLGEIEMVPEEMGRVFINLLDNAFAAVRLRAAASEAGYAPRVSVATHATPGGGVRVTIADNGTGMPDAVQARIFEPFFTTKPTGEGTGLGLSLSYDIVVLGHGGTLGVDSAEGEGTTFTVTLPGHWTPPEALPVGVARATADGA